MMKFIQIDIQTYISTFAKWNNFMGRKHDCSFYEFLFFLGVIKFRENGDNS